MKIPSEGNFLHSARQREHVVLSIRMLGLVVAEAQAF